MNLNYRNPTSPITSLGNVSAPLDVTYGTNYSVLSTGGYMEVYNLNDLDYVIPVGQTGLIEYSANTIPIQFNKGLGTVFSPDVLTLHSDNISSGRRKLGMLVYVYETKNIYQYTIDNYETLWTAATTSSGPGGPTVVISEFGTTIKNNSVAGQNFINAWTASTIEGVSGYTNLNATWRIFKGSPFSGGTIPSPTTFTGGLTATTFSAGTYLGLPLDVYTTGSTLIGDTIFFDRNDLLSAYSVNLSAFTPSVDIYTTGATLINDTIYFDRNDLLSAYSVNLSSFTPSTDVYVTGFSYSSNTLTIFDNSGNTFSATINDFTGLTINGGLSATTISGGTLYGDGSNLTGINFTGGTVSGDTTFLQGITANTISATTYQNLPIDPDTYVTGFTYSANTFTILDNSGNTFPVTVNDFTGLTINGDLSATTISGGTFYGDGSNLVGVNFTGGTVSGGTLFLSGLTATTISASTYQNLPIDPDTYVTGFTYSANTFTIYDNSGNTFDAIINDVTGLTVNGDLNVTGNTNFNGLTATTISATTYQNLPTDFNTFVTGFTYSSNTFTILDNSGNTFDATFNEVTGLTINGNLSVTGNTNLNGLTANTISASTYQNLPIDPDTYITGFTYSSNTFTILDNSGNTFNATFNEVTGLTVNGDFDVTGNTILNGLTANTISATTYQNLPIDPDTYVTGFTYSSNTFSISDNSGNTFNATINDVTGLTVNGTLSATTISANTIGNVQYIDFDTTQTGTTVTEGRLFWDVNNRTLSLGMIGGPVQQIGEEQYYLVENQTTGGTLNDGTVVRAVGTSGASGKLLVDYMIANGTIPAFTTVGVLTQPLNSGDTGYVTSFGLVRGLDTTGSLYGETWFNGTILYVSPTVLGGFTSVKPITPNQDIIIAIVMNASSGTTGSIFVRPDIYRPFKDPNRLIVAKQNGDFTTIKDALDTITASSSSNRYVIDVGPGEFYEPTLDLTNKPYVSIVGSNIQTTLIIPTGSTQHIMNIGINNEVSFLSFSGAGSGYAAIHCDDIGDFAQAHKCSFYDCDINVWIKSFSSDTKFYGEYLDFNGNYTYGTRVDANNGYEALANMENYFNFPTGSNITYCNWASGSGATLNIFLCDNISNGISGTTAFYIEDGAQLNASTITSDGCTYGIRNPNVGSDCSFDVDGASFINGEWDLYIENPNTFGTFAGSSNHEKVFTQSQNVYWAFLDINDGEFDITRKASVTFTDGSHTDFTTLVFEGGTMGLMDGGSITSVSATTINTAAGYGYLETVADTGIIRRIDWSAATLSLSADTENYIYITENGLLTSSGSIPNTFFNILLGRVVTNSTGIEFIEQSPQNANHISNRFSTFNRTALGPVYAAGSIVTEGTTPFTLDVSAGDYFFSENQFMPSGGTPITFTQYYRNGLGGWITSATTGVTNTYYDGNGVLSGLTGYTKHTLYVVGDGIDEKYFLVLGQNQYDTLVQTEGALLPTPPTYFDDAVTQIANIYVQSGTTGITQIEDIRPVIGFKAGGVNASSLHANLLGLSSDDHLQYLLVNGGRAMGGTLDMGTNNIISAGTINGVTIQSHASRHQYNGGDEVGTTTPTPNAIPYADVSGKLDSWISTASTTNLGLVKLSTSPVTPSIPIVVGENDTRFQNSFTGASFNDSTDTLTLNRVNGTSLSVTGITDYYVTGFSYDNANTITLSQNNGQSTGITLNVFTGITATTISATTISGGTFYGNGGNLTNVLTGATNIGTGLTLSNVTGTTLQIRSITADSTNKITTVINNDTLEIGIDEQNLTLWDLVVQGNKLIGGYVSWVSGLTFFVSDLDYIIQGVIYSAASTTVTLGSGDTLYDRIDVIYADTGSTIGVLSGTPSSNPEKPLVDNESQVEVTFVYVPANSTGSTLTGFTIYDENTGTGGGEWNFLAYGSQSSRFNPNFTGVTYSGSKSIYTSGFTGVALTSGFVLSSATPIDISQFSSLQFAIRNVNATESTKRWYIALLGATGNVISVYEQLLWGGAASFPSNVSYSTTNTSSFQLVSIPLYRFYTSTNSVYGVRFRPWNNAGTTQVNSYIDKIEFIEGAPTNPPTNAWLLVKGDGPTTLTPSSPTATLTISGGTNINSTVSGASTVNINLDNNISLNSVSATTITGNTLYSNTNLFVGNKITSTSLQVNSGLTATTISASTYQNLPIDPDTYVTAFTYNDANVITLSQNNGQSTGITLNIFTGLTINGTLSATTISGGTLYGDGSNLTNVPNIYNSDGSLTSSRVVNLNSNTLTFSSDIFISQVSVGEGSNSGQSNTILGKQTGISFNTAQHNVAIGNSSLFSNTDGTNNVSVGSESLYANTIGNRNISIGKQSLYQSDADNNTSIGFNSLFNNTTGSDNTSIGYTALFDNIIGIQNTAIGGGAGVTNQSGNQLTLIGYASDVSTDGLSNATAIGYNTQVATSNSLVLGNGVNVGIGTSSPSYKLHIIGTNTSSGTTSLLVQNSSLQNLLSVNNSGNVGIGTLSPTKKLEVSGGDALIYDINLGRGGGANFTNTILGTNALVSNTIGQQNVAVGYNSMTGNTSGTSNTSVGVNSMLSNSSGSNNTAIGVGSLSNNTTGSSNTSIGYVSLSYNTIGSSNVGVGSSALFSNTTGGANTAVGTNTLNNNTTGLYNTSIGWGSLTNNTTGSSNTAIGFLAGPTSSGLTNTTAIGANASVSTSNSLVLGSGVNVGINTSSPTEILDVSGKTKTINFQMTSGATNGFVLKSDASGNASWSSDIYVTGVTYSANTLTVNQTGGQSPINTTIGLNIKSGTVLAASFTGTPRTAVVTFTTAYLTTSYSIGVTGSDNRTFTYSNKTTTGFTISSNANTPLTGNVDWQTIAYGES